MRKTLGALGNKIVKNTMKNVCSDSLLLNTKGTASPKPHQRTLQTYIYYVHHARTLQTYIHYTPCKDTTDLHTLSASCKTDGKLGMRKKGQNNKG